MTGKEKKAIGEWKVKMVSQGTQRDELFKEMQNLYEECGGGKATCCLEANLEYLLTSNNDKTRSRALNIYANYKAANAQYHAMLELAQALANVSCAE